MNEEVNEGLLPQIFDGNFQVETGGSEISIKEIVIASGKFAMDVEMLVTEKLCSLPVARAKTIWFALDEESRNELTYHDNGVFNLQLLEKLNLGCRDLYVAFVSNLGRQIFELDNAPLSTPEYARAFNKIQSELLSTCKQLYSSKPNGKERSVDFLKCFDIEFLCSVVRHEIARYYLDELGGELDWDVAEDEENSEYIENEPVNEDLLEEPEDFDEDEIEKSEAEDFIKVFINGYNLPPALEFAYWLQHHAHGVYQEVNHQISFNAAERELNIWDRPNPLEPEDEPEKEDLELEMVNASKYSSGGVSQATVAVVTAGMEKEERRLERLYSISHPLRQNFERIYLQDFVAQSLFVANNLMESGKDTRQIQSFDQLRKMVWEVTGFAALKQWIGRQENPKQFVESSGKKYIIDEMDVLGAKAFGANALLVNSLEKSKALVLKLYGWFCLVKIFWNLANTSKRFLELAIVKNETLIWDEAITVNTLIFQVVLNSQKTFFTLDDVIRFCEAALEPGWVDNLKNSFQDLASANDALAAMPTFLDRIDFIARKAGNVFLIADSIRLSTKAESDLVELIKEIAKEHQESFIASLGGRKMEEEDIRDKVEFSFLIQLKFNPQTLVYSKHAIAYLGILLEKTNIDEWTAGSTLPENLEELENPAELSDTIVNTEKRDNDANRSDMNTTEP